MIQIKNLKKTFYINVNDVKALQNINLTFPDKGMVFIVGKSGSGKSTLLNILSGFDTPTSGEVLIGNKDITKFTPQEMDNYRSSCLGFIFQDFNLIENLSVYENVRLALSIKGQTDDELIKKNLRLVGLRGYENRKMSELSGGQSQRVAIARSLVKSPHIILADEPTGNLDSKSSLQVLKVLKKISKDNLVIIVSHNLDDAYTYGDRIIELSHGKIISDKERISTYKNEFKISEGVVTLPYKKEILKDQIQELNQALVNNEIIEIKQLNDGFYDVNNNDIEQQQPIIFDKSKTLFREIRSLTKNFFKNQKLLSITTLLLTTILITLFGLVQSFMNFDSKGVINDIFEDYGNKSLIMYKGAYDSENNYLSTSYIVDITDEDFQKFTSSNYDGNFYKLYSYAIPISNSYYPLSYGEKQTTSSNVAQFYMHESAGLLLCDEEYLTKTFGEKDGIRVLAGDLYGETGVIITDYLADSILYFQKKKYTSYEDIIGEYSLNGANYIHIKAIIDTNYEEKYSEFKKTYLSLLTLDSKYNKAEFLKTDECKAFFNDVLYNLGVAYTFDNNFLSNIKNIGAKNVVSVGDVDISYNGVTKSTNQKLSLHLDSLASVNLKDDEIMISYSKYNSLFGTNYTTKNYLTDFIPHNITITKYSDYKTISPAPIFVKEVKIVGLTNGSITSFRCNQNLIDELEKFEIIPFALYLDNPTKLGDIYDIIKDTHFNVGLTSYKAVDYISNIVNGFKKFFNLIFVFVIILALGFIAYFAHAMVNKNKKNIGILKSLGIRNKDILKIFSLQIIYLSISILILTTISYYIFTDIGNNILIDLFTNIYKSDVISTFTLIEPNAHNLAIDLLITFAISSLVVVLQINILKRINVINIIKSKE